MATPIRMPQPGQMTEECTILQWFKQEGDAIAKGDPLFEIETDKSDMDIEAFDTGTLLKVLVEVGETVPVDSIVAWIGEPGEYISDEIHAEAASASTAPVASPAPVAATAPVAAASPAEAASPAGERRLTISPRASRVAAKLGLDPSTVSGTGPGGRIVERDIRAAATTELMPLGLFPEHESPASSPAPPAETAPRAARVESGESGESGEGEPLSRLRQVIARRLTESVTTIPSFSVTVAVDMTSLIELRTELRDAGSPISITDFVHSAVIATLVEYPLVNSRTDGKTLWKRERVHLGIAVSIPGGLLVPVIRDADSLDLAALHDRTQRIVAVAREGTLGPDELSGSTFTVSNMGMFGVEQFTAIINPGESGILAVSSVTPEVVVVGEGMAVRQMMRLTLSADHRLVDGELGARFTNSLRERLQDGVGFRTAATGS